MLLVPAVAAKNGVAVAAPHAQHPDPAGHNEEAACMFSTRIKSLMGTPDQSQVAMTACI